MGLSWCLSLWKICLQWGQPGFDPWVGKIPWRRAWQPTPVFLPGESPWTEEPGGATVHGVTRRRPQLSDYAQHSVALKRSHHNKVKIKKAIFESYWVLCMWMLGLTWTSGTQALLSPFKREKKWSSESLVICWKSQLIHGTDESQTQAFCLPSPSLWAAGNK